MNSQFLTTDFPHLLEQLTPKHAPLWGRMTAQHMVEHLSALLAISNGKVKMPLMVTPEYSQLRLKQFFGLGLDFERNMNPIPALGTAPHPLRFANLDEAKQKCLAAYTLFNTYFAEHPTATPVHPVFGELNQAQWEEFHARHIHYHFRQFELVE